jgi:hypothetical protein
MPLGRNQSTGQVKRVAIWYNQLVNAFWSILNFSPIGYFWFVGMTPYWFYTFLAVSVVTGFLPDSFFTMIRVGHTTSRYNKLGIRLVKRYTQDGDVVNALIRKRFPDYTPIRAMSVPQHLSKSSVNERFHFMCLVFFLLTTLYALVNGLWWWALIISLNNLFFNVYPIMLQQYNRLRFEQLQKRRLAVGKTH